MAEIRQKSLFPLWSLKKQKKKTSLKNCFCRAPPEECFLKMFSEILVSQSEISIISILMDSSSASLFTNPFYFMINRVIPWINTY